ncbi:MAG: hypothetical protein JWR70_3339 [Modestobacter sp.]|nr:hypothetical protein [Modestobacter sp.]
MLLGQPRAGQVAEARSAPTTALPMDPPSVRSTWFSATALPVCAAGPTTTVEPQPQWLPWLTASSRLIRAPASRVAPVQSRPSGGRGTDRSRGCGEQHGGQGQRGEQHGVRRLQRLHPRRVVRLQPGPPDPSGHAPVLGRRGLGEGDAPLGGQGHQRAGRSSSCPTGSDSPPGTATTGTRSWPSPRSATSRCPCTSAPAARPRSPRRVPRPTSPWRSRCSRSTRTAP